MNKAYIIFLAFFSGILFFLGWPREGFYPLLFVAWLPLLHIQQIASDENKPFKNYTLFLLSYLAFLTWNISSTWWIYNASHEGAAMAIFSNTLLMAIVFTTAHIVSRKNSQKYFSSIHISLWIAFEFFHQNWDLTWPWLTLGNGLATRPDIIQWYEYTGTLGGSLWILLINHLLYDILLKPFAINESYSLKNLINTKKEKIRAGALLILVAIPVSVSEKIYDTANSGKAGKKINVVVVQPNIDPYHEKFSRSYEEQILKMLKQVAGAIDSTTDYLIFPETAITENLWENDDDYLNSKSINLLKQFLKGYQNLKIITGASTARYMGEAQNRPTPTSKKHKNSNQYFEDYNTALQLDNNGLIQKYHKSKLVPGVEKMPYPAVFGFLEDLAIGLGGTSGTLTGQAERSVFISKENTKTAPVICYESIFGEFTSEYIRNGAQFITIITNDGWWGNTQGYKQHLAYGGLRAIETRRWIARSANTGISCFINERGDILHATPWWKPAVIKQQILLHDNITFYVKHGDYLGKFAGVSSLLFIAMGLMRTFRNRSKKSHLNG